jgi:hypothetical protein
MVDMSTANETGGARMRLGKSPVRNEGPTLPFDIVKLLLFLKMNA